MRFAFTVFRFFPFGGISRDLTKFAEALLARGHEVRAYAIDWEAELPGVDVVVVPVRGIVSHRRYARFAQWVQQHLEEHPVDLVVGMNKMAGLDVYYAGDSCYEEKARTQRPWYYRLMPRYRHFAAFERAVFGDDRPTKILTIASSQQASFARYYHTPGFRFYALPPGIERDRSAPLSDEARTHFRRGFGLGDDDLAVLFVGSGFIKKGLDRLLRAVAAQPPDLAARLRVFVVGEDKSKRFRSLASRLGIAGKVDFMGGRDDVPSFLASADAFVLPAYDEAAGMVILEAIIAGLPALATANCGYAEHIERAGAGIVSAMPFDQRRFDGELTEILTSSMRSDWSAAGRRYGIEADLHSMVPTATALFERFAAGEVRPSVALCAYRFDAASGLGKTIASIAARCIEAGYEVQLYALESTGEPPRGVELVAVPVASVTHYKRLARFSEWVSRASRRRGTSCVVAFGPVVPGDVVYLRQPSLADVERRLMPKLYRSGPAHRIFADLEARVEMSSGAVLVAATAVAAASHAAARGIAPPSIVDPIVDLDAVVREAPDERGRIASDRRSSNDDLVVLGIIGSDLTRSGLDRLLRGVAAMPADLKERTAVYAAGPLPEWTRSMVAGLGLEPNFHARAAAVEVAGFYRAIDVMVLPAYDGVLGTALLEALHGGKAIVTVASVPYAHFVEGERGAVVLPAPFDQIAFNEALARLAREPGFLPRQDVAVGRRWASAAGADEIVALIAERMSAGAEPPMVQQSFDSDGGRARGHAGSV